MCGISALIGLISLDILFESLNQLQNRGYDSAGISSIKNNNINITKYAATDYKTSLELLKDISNIHINSNNCIAHTRWATHGSKTDNNSHPHISLCKKFSLVHNGIIENYDIIKQKLLKHNYIFKSETDSEVIVNLLSYNYKNNKYDNIKELIKSTLLELKGSWALVIQFVDEPNILYCTKKGNPLLVGKNNKNVMITSEESGFCNYYDSYIILKNNDICQIIYNNSKTKIITNENYIYIKTKYKNNITRPEQYKHWTIKEINDQPVVISNILSNIKIVNNKIYYDILDNNYDMLSSIDNLIILGCGTSYYSGQIGKSYFEIYSSFNIVLAYDGADFMEYNIPKIGKTACILISQSGETKDLYRCIDIAKKRKLITIGIINVENSLIAREVDLVCYCKADKEVAVASTKSFTSQIFILSLISLWYRQIKTKLSNEQIVDIKNFKNDIIKTINITIKNKNKLMKLFYDQNNCFILGKHFGEYIAKECALKLKEIAYINAEGYTTSSLKHGPLALITKNYPIIIVSPKNINYQKSINTYNETSSRGANVLFITDNNNCKIKNSLILPVNNLYSDFLCVIPIQILAYNLAVNRNINPDIPRNLAKVVTVE